VTLISGKIETEYYIVVWNAVKFPSGLYICRMEADRFYESIKLVLAK